jgi:hypothetical protein
MKRFARQVLLLLFALLSMPALAEDCDPRFAKSPQFAAAGCTFQNPPNPNAKPHRSTWDIWSRLLLEKKNGAVPVDPVPVRMLDRAALAALDNTSNHVIRLGHSSHLLKLQRPLLADRPGVRRPGVAGQLCRAAALSPAAAGAGRPAADRRPGAVARPLRPPRPADHHRSERPGAALLRAAGRGRSGCEPPAWSRSASRNSTGGKAPAMAACR